MQLNSVVPWGRSLAEYKAMFNLTQADLSKTILGCSDGPASFNTELSQLGGHITSIDPLYQFSQEQIQQRIDEVTPHVIAEVTANQDDFVWQNIRSPQALKALRLQSMQLFLDDYEKGRQTERYLNQSLPKLSFQNQQFELALCSHFLFLYSEHLSLEFHQQALLELIRVAKEVRIYPLLTLNNKVSPYLNDSIEMLNDRGFTTRIEKVAYEFQRGAKEMLVIENTTT